MPIYPSFTWDLMVPKAMAYPLMGVPSQGRNPDGCHCIQGLGSK